MARLCERRGGGGRVESAAKAEDGGGCVVGEPVRDEVGRYAVSGREARARVCVCVLKSEE